MSILDWLKPKETERWNYYNSPEIEAQVERDRVVYADLRTRIYAEEPDFSLLSNGLKSRILAVVSEQGYVSFSHTWCVCGDGSWHGDMYISNCGSYGALFDDKDAETYFRKELAARVFAKRARETRDAQWMNAIEKVGK